MSVRLSAWQENGVLKEISGKYIDDAHVKTG